MADVDQLAGLPPKYDYIRDVVMKYTRSGRDQVNKYQPEASFIFYLLWVLNELVPWPADGWVPPPPDRASGA